MTKRQIHFEPIEKQPREYERDGVLIADYT